MEECRDTTFVTAFYDLSSLDRVRQVAAVRDDDAGVRTSSAYLAHAEFLLSQDLHLVIYTSEDFAQAFTTRRADHGHADKTLVVTRPFEDLELAPLIGTIDACRRRHPVRNANPHKDTPHFTALMLQKLHFLRESIELNPWRTTHVAWIDLAIAHVAAGQAAQALGQIAASVPDRIRLCSMMHVAAAETYAADYYDWFRSQVCGGFLIGPRALMLTLTRACLDQLRRCIEERAICPNDEQLLAVAVARLESLFDPYYGDYADILANYAALRGSVSLVLRNAQRAREAGDYRRLGQIVTSILAPASCATQVEKRAALELLIS